MSKNTGQPSTSGELDAARYFGIDVPFMRYIGLEPDCLEPDFARARLPLNADLVNSRGDIHGGTLMSALDFVLSAAARSNDRLGLGVITIDMVTHFLGSARTDLVFEARIMRRGSRIVFCEGSAIDAEGSVVCTARATFKLVPRRHEAEREAGRQATAGPA
jgi:uncharacterized protein (TIGR00369 family)